VVPQDQVMASLKLFAKEVMPMFAKKPADTALSAEALSARAAAE
jgi:hypothetical protein